MHLLSLLNYVKKKKLLIKLKVFRSLLINFNKIFLVSLYLLLIILYILTTISVSLVSTCSDSFLFYPLLKVHLT